ncbi:WSC domain-containing protein 1 [Holothuria leucospilota]|uniref:WSC domain-containing protein 1 n=1 Tax=Holothuria leucospilota TaxID=206669 RepID=A0A9Q1BZR0_HOLLE|nr:WSC domain-containing protein 1 [Holothuria leucospilota]
MRVTNVGQWLFLIFLTIAGLLWTISRPGGDAELSISKNSLIQAKPKHFFKKFTNASKQRGRNAGGSNRVYNNIVEPNVNRSLMNITEKEPKQYTNCEKEIKFAPKHSTPLVALASFPRSGNTWTRYMLQIATQIYTTSIYWKNEIHMDSSTEIWIKSTEKSFINWHDLNLSWIKNSKRLLIVYYTDLIEHPERELTRMTMFLDQPVRPHLIRCATQAYPWRDRNHLPSKPFFPSRLVKYIQEVNKTLIEKNARPLPSHWA